MYWMYERAVGQQIKLSEWFEKWILVIYGMNYSWIQAGQSHCPLSVRRQPCSNRGWGCDTLSCQIWSSVTLLKSLFIFSHKAWGAWGVSRENGFIFLIHASPGGPSHIDMVSLSTVTPMTPTCTSLLSPLTLTCWILCRIARVMSKNRCLKISVSSSPAQQKSLLYSLGRSCWIDRHPVRACHKTSRCFVCFTSLYVLELIWIYYWSLLRLFVALLLAVLQSQKEKKEINNTCWRKKKLPCRCCTSFINSAMLHTEFPLFITFSFYDHFGILPLFSVYSPDANRKHVEVEVEERGDMLWDQNQMTPDLCLCTWTQHAKEKSKLFMQWWTGCRSLHCRKCLSWDPPPHPSPTHLTHS